MENENETDLEAEAEGEVNWEQRARELEDKARSSREKNSEYRKQSDAKLAALETELKTFKESQNSQPTGTNYGELAYFEQKGLNHSDDVKVVKEEASRLNLPYTDILAMKHIQDKLQVNREERIAKEGLPAATGGASSSPKGTVEYWLNQGEGKVPMTPDGNLNQELAEKVVEARLAREKSESQFGPIL